MIILLNGASSSGKSAIGEELKNIASIKLLHLSIDDVFRMYPHDRIVKFRDNQSLFTGILMEINAILFKIAKEMDEMKLNVVVDVVFERPEIPRLALKELSGRTVFMVGVFCSLEVLELREKERTNRMPGLARSHVEIVHENVEYDLTVDTSSISARECAAEIERWIVKENLKPGAFVELGKRISAV